jgi:DNA repair photolyase
MAKLSYIPITCKSAVNRVKGMPFNWSLNPYRGCVHACQYCYARETHAYLGLNAGTDFERSIFYKANIADVLRRELAASSWPGESIAIGTATDAYQPVEGRLRLTRSSLEVMVKARNPVSIVTKSGLIRRDIDLLAELQQLAGARVYFTITTLDTDLWRSIEPGTPPPTTRLQTMRLLAEAGIVTGVLMAPVMPGLTDQRDTIQRVAEAAVQHGAGSFTALPLRLAPLVKDHYLSYIASAFPDRYAWYAKNYRGDSAPDAWKEEIENLSNEISRSLGLHRRERPQAIPPLRLAAPVEQLSFF